MSTEHDSIRILIGAYVLGGLSEADRRTLETHLPACDECRDELASFAPLTGLLRRAPHAFDQTPSEWAEHVAPGDAPGRPPQRLEDPHRIGSARRRNARLQRLLLVAAAVVLVAALGVAVLLKSGQRHQPSGPTVAFSTATGYTVTGRATLVAKPWGTSVTIALANLPAQGPFTLRISSADGRTEPACTWATTPTATAAVTGGTSTHLSDIHAIMVVDDEGHILATARPA